VKQGLYSEPISEAAEGNKGVSFQIQRLMKTDRLKNDLRYLLAPAGIEIDGNHPWDIQVRNNHFFERLFAEGTLGAGEAYVEGWWECAQLDELIARVMKLEVEKRIKPNWKLIRDIWLAKFINFQSRSRAWRNGQRHYDLGNDLFSIMLGKSMTYTCGYWKNAQTLDEAQQQKLDLVCRKINLQPGMHVLDIGCGWGSFAKYAAENYDVQVTGITISPQQVELGSQLCKGLPVHLKLMDYRDLKGTYDRIVSLGMFEHVGYKNHRKFMQISHRCLKDNGLFLLHTIGTNESWSHTDPWINKYIFPGSLIPSVAQIGKAIEGLFTMEDWHNFGKDYVRTLRAWYDNFNKGWNKLLPKYDETFYRLWKYYLLVCAGTFKAGKNHLWQIVLSKGGVPGGYVSVR
jgi:cyclopropane-fatty-acyl-phospholipid synthase